MTILTLAPEKAGALDVIEDLSNKGIVIALGHSMANLSDGEKAVQKGSNLITHLFNAMLPVSNISRSEKFFQFFSSTIFFFPNLVSSSGSWPCWSINIGCCTKWSYCILWHNIGRCSYASVSVAHCLSGSSRWPNFGHRCHFGIGFGRRNAFYWSIVD